MFPILSNILSSEEISLENDEEGNVVVVIRDEDNSKRWPVIFHLHYFRLLELLKRVLMEFNNLAVQNGRHDSGALSLEMTCIHLFQISCWIVSALSSRMHFIA